MYNIQNFAAAMPRKVKEEAQRTRERILVSALSLFTKKGYEHTTFNDIASRLKMTKGAVYWHFESKEALLVALIDEKVRHFTERISSLISEKCPSLGNMTYPEVASIMVETAADTVSHARRREFFLLLHEQVRWSSSSMDKVRDELLRTRRNSPFEAFKQSIENGKTIGSVRADVDAAEVACCSIALWNGLVYSHISQFLQCNLISALKNAYAAIWRDIVKQ